MSYRTINVHGTNYDYVIGPSVIHIKGVGDFPTKVHGNPVYVPEHENDHEGTFLRKYVATPATVKALILGRPTPVRLEGTKETRMMINPFGAEIRGTTEYIPYDPVNFWKLKDDI